MRKYWMTALAVALGALLGGALFTSPASATPTQESPITVVQSDCADGGEVTIKISGVEYNVSSDVKTAGLAARVNGEVFANTQVEQPNDTYLADEELVIGPFEVDTVVEYRWFAGPIRNDIPMWNMEDHPDWADTVEERESTEERHWDARDDAPFVTWLRFEAEGCPSEIEPSPEPEPEPEPSPEPTPSGETPSPTASPSEVEGEGGEQLPVTGSSLPYVVGAGAALLGLGTGVVLLTRKRKQHFITE
jgi:LPXTG-motif cell wall-anchored protein